MKSIDEFLNLLKNVKPSAGKDNWMACCPAHNDGQHKGGQSLSVTLAGDKILLKCFAGCQTPDIVKTLGLTMSDLFIGEKKTKTASPVSSRKSRKISVIYPYHNIGNQVVFEVVRYEPKSFSQRRPDGKGGYINNMNGVERVIYRLPQVTAAILRGETIYHVEGEKDADNLVKLGIEATTSPQGAGNWKPSMAGFYTSAKVIILPDKDEAGRVYAREVAADILKHVQSVKMLELPGDGVKDASDWIAAGGTAEQLAALVADAPDWRPPAHEPDGIDYDEVRKLLKKASNGQYTIEDQRFQRIYWVKNKGEDEPEEKHTTLGNFVAQITDDITEDDGADQTRFFRIQGRLNGAHLPSVTIAENQFDSMSWARKHWGVRAQISKTVDKIEKHFVQSIILSSGNVNLKTVYTHTGWREIDGQQVYLTAGGGIGRSDIEVKLPPPVLNRIHLPQPDGNPKEAIEKSFELMQIGDIQLTLPTFIWPYLSVLNVFIDTNFAIWYLGKTGSFKTVLISLAMSHFGDFTFNDLRTGWDSTAATLEKLSHCAKDILFPVDDYAPAPDKSLNRVMKNTVAYIIQGFANRQGKGRSKPDMTSQITYFPRGLLISSGEHLPPITQSRQARIFPIPISRDNFFTDEKGNYAALTEAQENRRFYPIAMSHYIAWIQSNWAAVEKIFRDCHDEYQIKTPKAGIHLRLPETVAIMQAGYRVILEYASHYGVIPSAEIANHMDLSWDIFMQILKAQSYSVNQASPGRRFIDVLQTLIASGRLILRHRDVTGAWAPADAPPGLSIIGWQDDAAEIIYLNPGPAYEQVFTHCDKIQDYFGHPPKATWDDLTELGYLADRGSEETRTILKPKRFGGPPIPVIWLKRSVIYGESENSEE